MTNTKHTPGPWCLPHFAEPKTNCQCEYVIADNMFGSVASVHCSGNGDDWISNGDNPKFKEAVANAHLIAAAPDLLEALELAQLWLAVDGRYDMQGVNAAISKAKGQTE